MNLFSFVYDNKYRTANLFFSAAPFQRMALNGNVRQRGSGGSIVGLILGFHKEYWKFEIENEKFRNSSQIACHVGFAIT